MKQIVVDNRYFFGAVALLAALEGILWMQMGKAEVTLWVNAHGHVLLDKLFMTANSIGTACFSVAAVLVLWIRKGWRTGLRASVCVVSVLLITQFAKHSLFPGTPRPMLWFEAGALRPVAGIELLTTESFPSGHTSAAFALATFFALYWPHKPWHWLLALLAFSVGCARVYLLQHFITDVYAGMLLGVIVPTLIYCYWPPLRQRKEQKE
jgi:membrane-associated phospholipid phosphatase